MKITKNIGMLLLAVYLIIDGLLGFGLNLGPAIFLLYVVALAAAFSFSSANNADPVPNIAGGIRLLQVFIEPRHGLFQPIDLMLGFDEHMAFAGIHDQLCGHA
jgi:hypothetical protein